MTKRILTTILALMAALSIGELSLIYSTRTNGTGSFSEVRL